MKRFPCQVQTGLQTGEKNMVGFFNCTHLHAPQGRTSSRLAPRIFISDASSETFHSREGEAVDFFVLLVLGEGDVRCEQMDMITKWMEEFQSTSRQQDEVVVFDVLCGDFNFDNCSPGRSQKSSGHNPVL